MKKYFFLLAILGLVSCRKYLEKNSEKFSLTGKFVDDITGEPVTGSGTMSVDGNTWGNDVWLSTSLEEGIGSGAINNDGSFSASFKPKNCDHYMFWIWENTKSKNYYYPDYLLINRSEFVGGRKDTTIKLPRYTDLRINFRNISPFDNNDRLDIRVSPINVSGDFVWKWENLQNCLHEANGVHGGANAQGTLSAVVASDRGATIWWDVTKNGVYSWHRDTVYCARNAVTIYDINY